MSLDSHRALIAEVRASSETGAKLDRTALVGRAWLGAESRGAVVPRVALGLLSRVDELRRGAGATRRRLLCARR
jgi:hypothetical protein